VTSFDINPRCNPDIEGDICNDAISKEKYDVIVMAEVLEHLHSPAHGLANVHDGLKAGGRLLLSTPFILPIHDAPHDYFRFTRYGLALLLSDFREVNIRARNDYFETIDVLWARLLQTGARRSRLLCSGCFPLLLIKKPLTRLLGMFVKSDSMTTGYVVTAEK
jgi:SAM-dependent methyltransferase